KASAQQELERAGISKEKSLFMISILGSSPQKTYPLNYMAEVLDFIVSETRAQLLFNYIPKQKKEAEALLQRCSPETKKSIFFDVFGKNLREFLALTSCCDALIGNEGGAINMAKALNIPTFSIFSPQIKKENWSIYEDGIQNIAVHLRDYRPQAFTAHSKKELLKKSVHFYEQLNPNLIFAELKDFLNKNSKK
ncbi:MAG TPA: glycosyltransferase family 9 protein, partial [Salinimicrobium sp.]|nr:glycosyltransferase family 9 protein [Salinimicrobium sp.]